MRTFIVSAYACEPLKGSEPAVGWNWVLQLAQNNKVHVITRANNQEVNEKHIPNEVSNNLTFHYYDTPNFIKKLKKRDKGLYFYNFCWQTGIVKIAKRIAKKEHVDYVMHLTFGSVWMPSFLYHLKEPFIWGPIGGGECVPRSFFSVLPWKQKIVQYFRYFLNASVIINPFVIIPACRAKLILARTPNTQHIFPSFLSNKTKILLETAMDDSIFLREKKEYDTDVVNIIISARLISIKNILTAVRSLKYIKTDKKWNLTIIGSGPDLNLINNEIEKQQLRNIEIIPYMPREKALDKIEQSDIFLFPSLKEGGTWALMEAMAIGLPVVCVNWAGMAVETDANSAIQLEVTNPQQMSKEMGNALTRLIENPSLREKYGKNARQRIKDVFSWSAKVKCFEGFLDEIEKESNE